MTRPVARIPERLPYRPIKRDNRPAVGRTLKGMTTMAGLVCRDGVVLCAETQISHDYGKYSQSKFRAYSHLNSHPVFVFESNNVGFTEAVIERLVDRIIVEDDNPLTAIQNELHAISDQFPEESKLHELLLVIRPNGVRSRVRLFHIVGRVLSPVANHCCRGDGLAVAHGIITELFSPHKTLEEAAYIAAFMLAEAKKYGGYSGGDSEIMLCWHDRPYTLFPRDEPLQIFRSVDEIESLYFEAKRLFHYVLTSFCENDVSQESMERIFKLFQSRLTAERGRLNQEYQNRIEHFRDMGLLDEPEPSEPSEPPDIPDEEP
jgi:hypothetical protein